MRGEASRWRGLAGGMIIGICLKSTALPKPEEQVHGEHERHEDVEASPTGVGVGHRTGDTGQRDGHADRR